MVLGKPCDRLSGYVVVKDETGAVVQGCWIWLTITVARPASLPRPVAGLNVNLEQVPRLGGLARGQHRMLRGSRLLEQPRPSQTPLEGGRIAAAVPAIHPGHGHLSVEHADGEMSQVPQSWDYADDQIPLWYREWEQTG